MYEVEDRHWWYVGLHELILATIQKESRRLNRPLKVFEAGCGTGRLWQLLEDIGCIVSGCDASEEALRLCRLRGIDTMVLADLNTIELAPDTYDVISSIDVLYHADIADDVEVLRRLRRGLKTDGKLILNLVAHEFLRSTHDIAVHTRERYSRNLVSKRLLDSGFEVESATYRVSILFPLIAVYRTLANIFTFRNIKNDEVNSDLALPHQLINKALLNLLKMENRLLISGIKLPLGSSVFVVARKSASYCAENI
jgi:SAM-dependent methyltransferase